MIIKPFIIAAFLYAQLENIDDIQAKRKAIWDIYYENLQPFVDDSNFKIFDKPNYATINAHMFFLTCHSPEDRGKLIKYLRKRDIQAVFHYQGLKESKYYKDFNDDRVLTNCNLFTDCLVRLPLYCELSQKNAISIVNAIQEYYNDKSG